MSDTPNISVVMSAYNGVSHLSETIESVLTQEGVSLEFIIVNDGSTDESPAILEQYARQDCRVKIIHQENQGLTKALIKGCAEAKGRYIARQDVGDTSLANRLVSQLTHIRRMPTAGFVSSGARFIGPEREHLYDSIPNPIDATDRLLALELGNLRGPAIHGCTLFSREIYEQVGGYRPSFYFAQDLDLWIRIAEQAKHLTLPDILYQARIEGGSISGLYRKEQFATARLILESARLRRSGRDDTAVLQKAELIRPTPGRSVSRLAKARWLYFIGTCLRRNSNPRAADYFRQAWLAWPPHLKSAVRLLLR